MKSHTQIRKAIEGLGPYVVNRVLAQAALGDWDAAKTLMPYIVPRAARALTPISARVEVDISSTDTAKATIARIAAAIGNQEIGMEEGVQLMDVVGRALERMSIVDIHALTERIEQLEKEGPGAAVNVRQPVSRANGSTPTWGNIIHHPSLKRAEND